MYRASFFFFFGSEGFAKFFNFQFWAFSILFLLIWRMRWYLIHLNNICQDANEENNLFLSYALSHLAKVFNLFRFSDSVVPYLCLHASDHLQKPLGQQMASQVGMAPPPSYSMYGYQGSSKEIHIPNGRVLILSWWIYCFYLLIVLWCGVKAGILHGWWYSTIAAHAWSIVSCSFLR